MEQLAEGVRLLVQGRAADARSLYLWVWSEASDAGDHFTACAAAHLLGVMESMSAAEKLAWHLASLECANRVQQGRADDWFASIYVNLGQTYLLLDQTAEALAAYREALRRTQALNDHFYAEALRASIEQALTDLKGDGVSSPSEPSPVPRHPPEQRSAP